MSHRGKGREVHVLQPTFIDLFCGCGGFSLGLERAGLRCLAAIDFNKEAVAVFRTNFPLLGVDRVRQEDLTNFDPNRLAELIGTTSVDVITGGPPCQGFSTARQRDGANHGTRRFVDDKRRHLYRDYLRYVGFFRPRIFIMENVLGIRSAAGGEYFTRVQHEARLLGYRVAAQTVDAFTLGVPQKRRRQLIIGVRADLPGFFPALVAPAPRAVINTTLRAAIGDLPPLSAGGGSERSKYNLGQRLRHLATSGDAGRNYLFNVLEVERAEVLTAHRARPHSERDLRDFLLLREGENSAEAMRRGTTFEFPYDKSSFKDRYTRQSRCEPCSTIVAHLSKDGLMFVHPTQNRSLTPREAARIQSFPDWFDFPVARTHQFRLIGNAVPPLVSEAVGFEIRRFLQHRTMSTETTRRSVRSQASTSRLLPRTAAEATEYLEQTATLSVRDLQLLERRRFLQLWFAVFYLLPDLHPANAVDHGERSSSFGLQQVSSTNLGLRFHRSGWPVHLERLGREGWRRFRAGALSHREFYCAHAQIHGIRQRSLDRKTV